MQVCRASGCGDCGVHLEVWGKVNAWWEASRETQAGAGAGRNAWDNYVGQLLLLLRYTRHTAIVADPCAGA